MGEHSKVKVLVAKIVEHSIVEVRLRQFCALVGSQIVARFDCLSAPIEY